MRRRNSTPTKNSRSQFPNTRPTTPTPTSNTYETRDRGPDGAAVVFRLQHEACRTSRRCLRSHRPWFLEMMVSAKEMLWGNGVERKKQGRTKKDFRGKQRDGVAVDKRSRPPPWPCLRRTTRRPMQGKERRLPADTGMTDNNSLVKRVT
ncbi:hypothetical protein ACJZ2D_003809 [Fusarium nematophilum]